MITKVTTSPQIEGHTFPTQLLNGQVIINVKLKPFSFTTFVKEKIKEKLKSDSGLILENHLVKYEFNDNGTLKVAYDKEQKLNLLKNSGNVLSLYEDRPLIGMLGILIFIIKILSLKQRL